MKENHGRKQHTHIYPISNYINYFSLKAVTVESNVLTFSTSQRLEDDIILHFVTFYFYGETLASRPLCVWNVQYARLESIFKFAWLLIITILQTAYKWCLCVCRQTVFNLWLNFNVTMRRREHQVYRRWCRDTSDLRLQLYTHSKASKCDQTQIYFGADMQRIMPIHT